MRLASLSALLAVILCSAAFGQTVGWRGDGSGRFPAADPPAEWQKLSKLMAGLRCVAEQSKDGKPAGLSVAAGAVPEWEVVGPIPAAGDKAIDEAVVENEGSIQPDASGKLKGLAWRKISVPGTTLDFSPIWEKDNPDFEYYAPHGLNVIKKPFVAYAHSWIYSAEEGKVVVRVRAERAAKVWVNGELVYPAKGASVATLKKGWNRILAKAANHVLESKPKTPWVASGYPSWWYLDLSLTAAWPYEWTTKNIRWQTELPNVGVANPVIVGERIFVMAEPGRVLCVDKKTGAVLWDREPTFFDTLSAEEKKSPAFKPAADEAAKLDAFRDAKGLLPPDAAKLRDDAVAKVNKLMAEADAKRFTVKPSMHGNCLPTPASDGTAIYIFLSNGLAASYTLDGTFRWAAAVSPERNQEHGMTSSVALAGGKVLVFHCDLAGIDAGTGRIAWKTNVWRYDPTYGDLTHQTPVTFKVAGQDYAFIHGLIIRVSDGEVCSENRGWAERQDIPTALVDSGNLYVLISSGKLLSGPLPATADDLKLAKPALVGTFTRYLGAATHGFTCASPLIVDGLAYAVDCMGTLFVIDLKEQKVVYQQELGTGFEARSAVHQLGTSYASPIYAGGRIYVFGMDGTAIVFKPGQAYQEIARNRIEDVWNPPHWSARPEGFASSPIAEGKFLYVRGDKYLYCIGEKP